MYRADGDSGGIMADSSTSSGGIGFAGLLTVAFVVLKLTGVIAWSWWWVLSPLWIGAVLFIVIAAIVILILYLTGNL
jgi:hypothetical protein